MKNHVAKILYIFLGASILISALLTLISGFRFRQDGYLFGGQATDLSGGWQLSEGQAVSLPAHLKPGAQGEAVLMRTLPDSLPEGTALLIRTNFLSVTVSAGGEKLYSWDKEGTSYIGTPFGLGFNIVDIPASAAGKALEVRLSQSPQSGGIWFYDARLGSGEGIVTCILNQNIPSATLVCILSAALLIVLFSLLFYRERLSRIGLLAYLSLILFTVLAVIWIASDSELAFLLTRNAAVLMYSSVLSLMLLPVPLLLYFRFVCPYGKRLLDLLSVLILLNFFVCVVLHVTGAATLLTTLPTSNILELVAGISIPVICLAGRLRHKKLIMPELTVGLIVLSLCSLADVIVYFMTRDPMCNGLFSSGLTAFILIIGFGAFRRNAKVFFRSMGFSEMVSSIPSGICRIDSLQSGRIVSANNYFYRMFGYTEAEAVSAGFTHIGFTILPEDKPIMDDTVHDCLIRHDSRLDTEIRHRKKNGEIIWILSRFHLDGGVRGVITAVLIDITDRKEAEEQLRISEEGYRIAAAHSGKIIVRYNVITKVCSRQGGPQDPAMPPAVMENVPESLLDTGIIAPDSVPTFMGFYGAILRGDRDGSAVISLLDPLSGKFKWYQLDFTAIFNAQGEPIQAIISMNDVTLQHQKELAFQKWQQSYNDNPKDSTKYYEYNLSVDLFENEDGQMLPATPESVPRTLSSMADYIAENYVGEGDRPAFAGFVSRDRLLELYSAGQYSDKLEFRRLSQSGVKWTSLALQMIPDPYSSDVKAYFLLKDIDNRKRQEISLHERSTQDSLTGLLNRATVVERIGKILDASTPKTQHALIMLDIDRFKTINDTLGHTAGDTILTRIASKLKLALRSDDLCGRIGGDEFVILLKNMNLGKPLEARVNDLCSLICSEKLWGLAVSASFGIAGYPQDGLIFEELYRKADAALYKVKQEGRGGYALYDPQLSFDDMTFPEP